MSSTRVLALAGLPASGKSHLARLLAPWLEAAVLDKDRLRAALFEPRDIEHLAEQDDLCCEALYLALGYLAQRGARPCLIVDGRTFRKRTQVERLQQVCHREGVRLDWILCRCEPWLARERLANDQRRGLHCAADRDQALFTRLEHEWEPLAVEHLELNTGVLSDQDLLRLSLDWLARPARFNPA